MDSVVPDRSRPWRGRPRLEWLRRIWLPLTLVIYVATGLYSVQSDQSAVAVVLGKAVDRDVRPGIHWNPPWPIGRVIVARTATSFTMPIGYRLIDDGRGSIGSDLWLTGDTNIVTAQLSIQFSIRSLTAFKGVHEAPAELIRRVGERVVTGFLIGEEVDQVLTTRRHDFKTALQRGVQAQLDAEGIGVEIRSVTLRELHPPQQGSVRTAFQEIQSARADRERLIDEARAYRDRVQAEAGGEAQRLLSEAMATRHRRIVLAGGEAARFRALAAEHRRAPAVTEQRLYLEALERLLPRLTTYIVEPATDGKVNLRILQ